MSALNITPDFTSDAQINDIHRKIGDADVYFLSHAAANPVVARCTFRVVGKTPQLWDPESGRVMPIRAWSAEKEQTRISVPFDANGSAFIVFVAESDPQAHWVTMTCNDAPILSNGLDASPVGSPPNMALFRGELTAYGKYVLTNSNGQTTLIKVPNYKPIPVLGPWTVKFPDDSASQTTVEFNQLMSWSDSTDDRVKYFSGKAKYAKTLTLPTTKPNERLYLDLGNVQVMARVRLNGKDLGILWKPPYRVDITSASVVGENALEIDVVNTWVNRMIGDEQLPEDTSRNANGTLKDWPQWLLDGKPSPTGRLTFSSWRLWKKTDSLLESGLIGPVEVRVVQQIAQ
jgi:hypothetical protein